MYVRPPCFSTLGKIVGTPLGRARLPRRREHLSGSHGTFCLPWVSSSRPLRKSPRHTKTYRRRHLSPSKFPPHLRNFDDKSCAYITIRLIQARRTSALQGNMLNINDLSPWIAERNRVWQLPSAPRFLISLIPWDIPGSFCEF